MTELKKCPFCGGEAEAYSYDAYDGYQGNLAVWRVQCQQCRAFIQRGTKEKAIEAWNRRAETCDTVRPVKSTKDINCLMCQYFLTGNNNYPCSHCSQGRENYFKLRYKAGEE